MKSLPYITIVLMTACTLLQGADGVKITYATKSLNYLKGDSEGRVATIALKQREVEGIHVRARLHTVAGAVMCGIFESPHKETVELVADTFFKKALTGEEIQKSRMQGVEALTKYMQDAVETFGVDSKYDKVRFLNGNVGDSMAFVDLWDTREVKAQLILAVAYYYRDTSGKAKKGCDLLHWEPSPNFEIGDCTEIGLMCPVQVRSTFKRLDDVSMIRLTAGLRSFDKREESILNRIKYGQKKSRNIQLLLDRDDNLCLPAYRNHIFMMVDGNEMMEIAIDHLEKKWEKTYLHTASAE